MREISARFPVFPTKRRRNKGAPFQRSEMSFEGGAGTKKKRSSMHVGREPEIEPTRLGFHINSAQVI